MQNKALIVVAVVLGIIALGLVTTVAYNSFAKGQEPDEDAMPVVAVDTRPVAPKYPEVRAKQEIPRGTRITVEMVDVVQTETPASGALTAPVQLTDHYANVAIHAGDPLVSSKLHVGPWKILVAATAIAAGARADEPNITTRDMTELPADAVEESERAKIIGRICRNPIGAGSLISENDFYQQNSVQLSYLIPVYKRAITIQITRQDLANSYLIKQGDAVDVIARFEQAFAGVDVTRTIVQNAEVLALDRQLVKSTANDTGGFSHVTLAVTPREAEKLAFANKHASDIRLVSRSPLQRGQRETENAVRGSLLGEGFGQTREIEIYGGGTRQSSQTIREY